MLKKVTVGISWEIWCSNQVTRRFDEKLGDSWKTGSWQVRALCHDPSDLGSWILIQIILKEHTLEDCIFIVMYKMDNYLV